MRAFALFGAVVFCVVLAGCGTNTSTSAVGEDAGQAIASVFGSGAGAAAGSTGASERVFTAGIDSALRGEARSFLWSAVFKTVAASERRNGRTSTWCGMITNASYTGTNFSCTVSCPSSVFTEACTNTGSFTSTCNGTTYTAASGGTFNISFADAPIPSGTLSISSLPNMNFSMSMTLSGGSLSSTTLAVSFTLNFGQLVSGGSSASSVCSDVSNFSASVNGVSMPCSALSTGLTACN